MREVMICRNESMPVCAGVFVAFMGLCLVALLGCVHSHAHEAPTAPTEQGDAGIWTIQQVGSLIFLLNAESGESRLLDTTSARYPRWHPIKIGGHEVSDELIARLKLQSESSGSPRGLRVADSWRWDEVGLEAGDLIKSAKWSATRARSTSPVDSADGLAAIVEEARENNAPCVLLTVKRDEQELKVAIWLRLNME